MLIKQEGVKQERFIKLLQLLSSSANVIRGMLTPTEKFKDGKPDVRRAWVKSLTAGYNPDSGMESMTFAVTVEFLEVEGDNIIPLYTEVGKLLRLDTGVLASDVK